MHTSLGFKSHEAEEELGQNNTYLLHPPDTPWKKPDPHGAASAAAVQADPPPRAKPKNIQYPGRPWLWVPPSHPGRAYWELQTNASDRNEHSGRRLLPQPPGVQHCVLPGGRHRCRWSARGSGPGNEGEAIGTNRRIHALPWAEYGEL